MFGKGKSYNDYGKGFYCTEHLEIAKEWACTENTDGYANKYEIDTAELTILNLSSDEYTILHWLALLMKYRKFRVSTPVMKRGTDWLKELFLIDLTPCDVVVGYRADDSYFSFARAFMNNEISLKQLSYKFVDIVNRMIRRKNPPTRLQAQRKISGYSQRELAEKVGVNLRTLQQYEIRAKDINKAAGVTLLALAKVLGCRVEDLLEYDSSEIEDDHE